MVRYEWCRHVECGEAGCTRRMAPHVFVSGWGGVEFGQQAAAELAAVLYSEDGSSSASQHVTPHIPSQVTLHIPSQVTLHIPAHVTPQHDPTPQTCEMPTCVQSKPMAGSRCPSTSDRVMVPSTSLMTSCKGGENGGNGNKR
eukprot:353875-Chlamydomonas_euryale.AAC.1